VQPQPLGGRDRGECRNSGDVAAGTIQALDQTRNQRELVEILQMWLGFASKALALCLTCLTLSHPLCLTD
jgi:hypothetical protein